MAQARARDGDPGPRPVGVGRDPRCGPNPFAVAIARFRLTVAALQACDLRSLEDAPAFKYHLAVGDSLIHGPDPDVLPNMENRGAFMPFHYATEDAQLLLELLEEGRYDVVVGNPPYITVKDKALNKICLASLDP